MYSFTSRIRFSETDVNSCLTLTGLMNYFQDCTTFQSESIGQGFSALRARSLAWILSSWQVRLHRLPKMGEEVIIGTLPYEFHGFFGFREFLLSTPEGERLCEAHSVWINMNIATGRPQKLTEQDLKGYELSERLGVEFPPRKIPLSATWDKEEPIKIYRHNLDSNRHVNNCQYISMAENYLEEGFLVTDMRVEYKQQGLLGDVFYPFIHRETGEEGERVLVLFNQGEDVTKPNPYAVVEFVSRK